MVLVRDVPTDRSAAATGLSLTFGKLEEVQTERRGEGKNQKERNPKNTNPQTKNKIHTQKMYTQLGLALGQKGRRKKRHKALKFSPQNTAGFFYSIRLKRHNVNSGGCLF